MSIAHELRRARTRAGLSQKRLAEAIGMDPGLVSNVERGLKSTTLRNIDAWLEACGQRVAAVPLDAAEPVELENLDLELRDLLLRLAHLMPILPPILVRDLQGRVDSWSADYGGGTAPSTQDSRANAR